MQGLSGAVVDNPPHTHARAGAMRLDQRDVSHPSMGLVWHAQIGAGLSMKGQGAQELYEGSMAYNEDGVKKGFPT